MSKMMVELNRPIEVLEIGAGSGANFKYYPKGTNIMCVDPNPYFDSYIKQNSEEFEHVNLRGVPRVSCRRYVTVIEQ